MSDRRELPQDRLSTTDETGRRVWLYVADMRGRFRQMRTQIHAALMIVFLIMPWLRWNGRPLLLLDVAQRQFTFFGATFWAHEAPLMFFLLLGLAIAIALATVMLGRVWCGFACPQTVFTDVIFRRVERWIEGDAVKRRQLDQGDWSSEKIIKKFIKWGLFTILSIVVGNSFLAYFVGTDRLIQMIQSSPFDYPESFLVMGFASAITLFDFGWFREQFCVILCPYGRFQSLLMDAHSWIVAYDVKRGEPRRGMQSQLNQPAGDCVNCYRCVQVCPTGIDIRRGVQMECIACTACIDACDEIMTKVGKPQGLIRYDTLAGVQGLTKIVSRPRVYIYALVLLLCVASLSAFLALREPLSVTLVRAIEAPYQIVGPQLIVNHYKVDLANQSHFAQKIKVRLPANSTPGLELVTQLPEVELLPAQSKRVDVFFKFSQTLLKSGRLETPIEVVTDQKTFQREVRLVGPFQ